MNEKCINSHLYFSELNIKKQTKQYKTLKIVYCIYLSDTDTIKFFVLLFIWSIVLCFITWRFVVFAITFNFIFFFLLFICFAYAIVIVNFTNSSLLQQWRFLLAWFDFIEKATTATAETATTNRCFNFQSACCLIWVQVYICSFI